VIKAGRNALILVLMSVGSLRAQAPTGTIAGVVTDSSNTFVAAAHVSIVNRATSETRTRTTDADGRFSADALPPGLYGVTAEVTGFKSPQRDAKVDAGTITTANLVLKPEVTQTIVVDGAVPLLRHDQHQVSGVITREQIENVPLNGRNFLDLAKLEPGVMDAVRATNNRTFVPVLGAGLQSLPRIGYDSVTVDGASITAIGGNGSQMQISQEAVQEFQISTVNFDASTNLTSNGAINIVTRSGANTYHGDGFFFYRDHNLSAYPSLNRDPNNPDPFFRRQQFGMSMGGPIRRDRAFFFATYERNDQHGVFSVHPQQFPDLGGIFPSPYLADNFSARVDVRFHRNHNAFVRFTHDGNHSFAPAGGPASPTLLPSAWSRLANKVDQSLVALTSTLSPTMINDARLSYFYVDISESPGTSADCPAPCVGLGGPRITIKDGGLALGQPIGTSSGVGGRYELSDTLVWQRGRHMIRLGADWQHSAGSSSSTDPDPATITLVSPLAAGIPESRSFTTMDDLLQLPLQSFRTSVGPGDTLERDFGRDRIVDLYRLFVSDTWRTGSRVTLNAGLGWSYEPNALNTDLTKPTLLTPILGVGGLVPPSVRRTNISPMVGFAWTATPDGKTVVRGGAGRYYDPIGSTNAGDLFSERQALFPLGTGRLTESGFPTSSGYTGADLLANLTSIQAPLLAVLNPNNHDFAVRNINLTKQAPNLTDPAYQTPYAVHVSAGVQRELAPNLVISADVVWRRFAHTFITGIDYNRWDSAQGPVIPKCVGDEREDPSALCSNGAILFSNTSGRSRYRGLLLRAEKRFSHRTQFLASYALGSWVGTNGVGIGATSNTGFNSGFNNDNWLENYGPLPNDVRHILNVSGLAELPWKFQVSVSFSAHSRPPFSAFVSDADFNGDGTKYDLLPGTTVNQFGRGLAKADLERLVESYNQQHPKAQITLPATYSFNDNFFTLDVRVARVFAFASGKARVVLLAEIFNLFNTANLTGNMPNLGYSGNLTQPATFGQPSSLATQVFGSGGPRACQLAARISF
jgi:hypothetical protein